MKIIWKVATAMVVGSTLSGCAAISGPFNLGSRAASEKVTAASFFGTADLVDGKDALQKGNSSLAVSAFQRAALNSATAGDAHNGLGIAYARLGRPDLAERHFAKAIALSPEDRRFPNNLARLYRSPAGERMLAGRQADAAREFAVLQRREANGSRFGDAVAAGPERRGELVIESSRSNINRGSRGEIMIAAAPREAGSTAPVAAAQDRRQHGEQIARSATPSLLAVAGLSILPGVAEPAQSSRLPGYPIRIALQPRPGASHVVGKRGEPYRLRVRLPADADY